MGPLIGIIISVIAAVWVRKDAVTYEEQGVKVGPFGPTGWAIAVFLLWIVFLPWYLIARSQLNKAPQAPPPPPV